MARVGIIIPAFNADRFLGETLESVLAQTESDWRCVVVDDGSHDATAAVARRFVERDRRFVLVKQANAGVSRARTAGLEALGRDTEFLIFLDADDVWRADALARLLAAIGDAPAVHATAAFVDADGSPIDSPALAGRLRRLVLREGVIVEAAPDEPTTSRMLATWPCVITPGVVLVRRDAWHRSGGWDASLSIGEDWELWHRLSLATPLAFVDEPLIRFRVYATSSSSTWKRPLRLRAARAKVMSAGSDDDRRYARQAFRAMSRRLGWTRIGDGFAALGQFRLVAAFKGIVGGTVNLALSVAP